MNVLAEKTFRRGIFQRSVGNHQRSAPRQFLLPGLEEQAHRPPEVRPLGLQDGGGSEYASRVDVVPTGVHHPFVPAGVVHVVRFPDGQGVRIGAEGDRRAGPACSPDLGDQAGTGGGAVGDTQFVQAPGDEGLRGVFLETQFGVLVEVAAQGHGPVTFGGGGVEYAPAEVGVGHNGNL